MNKERLGLYAPVVAIVLALAALAVAGYGVLRPEQVMTFARGWSRVNNLLVFPGQLKIGGGYPTTAQTGHDLFVEGIIETDGNANFDGDLDVDGTLNADAVDIDSTTALSDTVTISSDGVGADLVVYSGTAGDYFRYDASVAALWITGTNASDALEIPDGNVDIADDIDVDGTTNADVLDVDSTSALSDTVTVSSDGVGADVRFYSETAGDSMLWDASAEALIITGSNGQDALQVADGDLDVVDSVDIGTDIDIDGTTNVDVLDVDSTSALSDTVTVSSDGVGSDVIAYSATAGDYFRWDASVVAVWITGTNGSDALEIADGNVDIADDVDVDGTTNVDVLDVDSTSSLSDTVTVSSDGVGADVVAYSATAGDSLLWDASDVSLWITGTNGADAVNVGDGDLDVVDNVDIGGDIDVDGTTNLDAVDIDGAIDIAGQTVTWDSDSDTTSVASQDDVITYTLGAATGSFAISTGNLVVGDNVAPSLTLNGNDGYFEGTLESDGAARFDGGATVAGNLTISNGLFLPEATDLAVSDGDMITPTTTTVWNLDTTGEVTITIGTCTEPQFLYVAGDDANTININVTNLRTTDGGALAIDQYDILGFLCVDSEWLLMFENNLQ